jgi:hypothetical protein
VGRESIDARNERNLSIYSQPLANATPSAHLLPPQFAGEKQLEDVRQVVEEDDKAETILKGLKAGMTGSNNPGGLWKRIDGDESQQQSKVKKWVRIYEERVGKMYEKHRCRVGGGGIGPASDHNQEFSVEDFDIARLESIDVEEQYKKEKVRI